MGETGFREVKGLVPSPVAGLSIPQFLSPERMTCSHFPSRYFHGRERRREGSAMGNEKRKVECKGKAIHGISGWGRSAAAVFQNRHLQKNSDLRNATRVFYPSQG